MNIFQIKLIAIIAMLIDNIGLYFFPEITVFRIVGRLAFPLFAWLIANGAYHTHDIKKYLGRLGIFALISQLPYFLVHNQANTLDIQLNIFFTLFLSLFVIQIVKNTKNKIVWTVVMIGALLIAEIFRMEYGAAGIVSIILFYLFFNNFIKLVLSQLLVYLSLYFFPVMEKIYHSVTLQNEDYGSVIQGFSLVSLIFIWLYNGKLGIKVKYFFYAFYPFHLLLLYMIKKYMYS